MIEEEDVFDDLSFSFFMDRNNHGYIDGGEIMVNNYKINTHKILLNPK